YAKASGQKVLAVVNVPTSTIARESDYQAPTLAGPEIGVASTKAFTAQVTVLYLLALAVADKRGTIAKEHFYLDALGAHRRAEHKPWLVVEPGHITWPQTHETRLDGTAVSLAWVAHEATAIVVDITKLAVRLSTQTVSFFAAFGDASLHLNDATAGLILRERQVQQVAGFLW
ncbi:MAG: SIS domain-containing protein, partial [Actinobacteria bacterium]|nr:SIS domain-containing protein [Actinomycetota bacterium]